MKAGYAFKLAGIVRPGGAAIQITRYFKRHGKWVSYGRYNVRGYSDGTWSANVAARYAANCPSARQFALVLR